MSKKKRRIEIALADVQAHVGHRVTWYEGGIFRRGKVLRASIDAGFDAIEIWVESSGPFPTRIYSDQVRQCDCQGGDRDKN